MNRLLIFIAPLVMFGCAHQVKSKSTASKDKEISRMPSSHESHFPHLHKHGANCGHKTETIGFDTVYLHDGHKHKIHAGHVDDIK